MFKNNTPLVLPLCGKSSRFNTNRPKWMLTHPDGRLMVEHALDGFEGDIYAAVRKEYKEMFDAFEVLRKAFGNRINICSPDDDGCKTHSETVKTIIEVYDLHDKPIIVRDCDNKVSYQKPLGDDYIVVSERRGVQDDNKGYISQNLFSVGVYAFSKGWRFLDAYGVNKTLPEIICTEELGKIVPKWVMANNYVDWGTQKEWDEECDKYKTYFIDLDGVVFKNASKYFKPYWEYSEPLMNNVEWIKKLPKESTIIYVSARENTPEMHNYTSNLLNELGIPGSLILGLPHSQRIIINDKSPNATYNSCKAINIVRNGNIEDGSGC